MINTACNNFVLAFRDKTPETIRGRDLPPEHRVKPHVAAIHAVGAQVQDPKIHEAVGKKCLFHPTVGWEIEYEGVVYLVLEGQQIIAIP